LQIDNAFDGFALHLGLVAQGCRELFQFGSKYFDGDRLRTLTTRFIHPVK